MKKTHLKIKTGDTVQVMAGKDKGKIGKVLQIFTERNRVVVEGANFMKKHIKARGGQDAKGQILQLSAPMHLSKPSAVPASLPKWLLCYLNPFHQCPFRASRGHGSLCAGARPRPRRHP